MCFFYSNPQRNYTLFIVSADDLENYFLPVDFLFVPLQIESSKTEKMDNTACHTHQTGRVSTNTFVEKFKSTTKIERRMSVEEYFGKVLEKLDEHYSGLQEG
jgi:hypothetical protein